MLFRILEDYTEVIRLLSTLESLITRIILQNKNRTRLLRCCRALSTRDHSMAVLALFLTTTRRGIARDLIDIKNKKITKMDAFVLQSRLYRTSSAVNRSCSKKKFFCRSPKSRYDCIVYPVSSISILLLYQLD